MEDDTPVIRYKPASEYGKKRYAVELFVTERFVVTVYADAERQAVERALQSPYRSQTGLRGFRCANGVSHAHFDSDFDFQAVKGVVIDDTDD